MIMLFEMIIVVRSKKTRDKSKANDVATAAVRNRLIKTFQRNQNTKLSRRCTNVSQPHARLSNSHLFIVVYKF